MAKKIGSRRNQKLLRRMHEVLLEHGPMTASELSVTLKTMYPNNKRFHRNSQILSQVMVGRPKQFEIVNRSSRCHTWGALPEVVE